MLASLDVRQSRKRRRCADSDLVTRSATYTRTQSPSITLVSGTVPIQDEPIIDVPPTTQFAVEPADDVDTLDDDTDPWQDVMKLAMASVVSIHFSTICSFDTDTPGSSEATGFVVDAERGYILTNRHVVGPGPFRGHCIFSNRVECDVQPVYRDPVHDFGILRFNPEAVHPMQETALELRPESANVGVEIRLVGNDAGEELSVLSGVISRVDRNAPDYAQGYCDFNTNYIQAATAATGGSSGSPVINLAGHAVALQAGGREDDATTNYFLPLDRPLRALRCLQQGRPISRGCLQVQWMLQPYDQCKRLGLTDQDKTKRRDALPHLDCMLVAQRVLPAGPACGAIEEGDILIEINGKLSKSFLELDTILDDNVGSTVDLLVQRGGTNLNVTLDVDDLHAITPDRFVTVAGGSFHNLSYQQARLYGIACKGVYLCEAGGSFYGVLRPGCLIDAVDNEPTPNLDAFVEVLKTIPDRSRITVTFRDIDDLHRKATERVDLDRHWQKDMRLLVRNDETGLWDEELLAPPQPAQPVPVRSARSVPLDDTSATTAADVLKSFVQIKWTTPLKIDGYPFIKRTGYGLVIDADKGLVLVSRAVVPHDLCDITVVIADIVEVNGTVLFQHPIAGYSIVQYDAAAVTVPVRTANLSATRLERGQHVTFVGYSSDGAIAVTQTCVTDIAPRVTPVSTGIPRYRAAYFEGLSVDSTPALLCVAGALIGSDDNVQAFWLRFLAPSRGDQADTQFSTGVHIASMLPVIESIRLGGVPHLHVLDIQPRKIAMSDALVWKISDQRITEATAVGVSRHNLFLVDRVTCPGTDGIAYSDSFVPGDVILTLNGKYITQISDLDVMYNQPFLSALVARDGREVYLPKVQTVSASTLETTRVVICCGAVLQYPHHGVRQQMLSLPSGVYVSAHLLGSPAEQHGLSPADFITHVNSVATPDLDTFLNEVNKIRRDTYFRLAVATSTQLRKVVTIRKDDHYFPTSEYVRSSTRAWEQLSHPAHVRERGAPIIGHRMVQRLDGNIG